jgi:hypothetical protein
MLGFKPSSWTVSSPTPNASGGVQRSESYGSSSTVTGQITPASAEDAYKLFGAESNDSFLMLCDPADVSKHPVGAKVVWNGITLYVNASTKQFSTGLPNDHGAFMLERTAHVDA